MSIRGWSVFLVAAAIPLLAGSALALGPTPSSSQNVVAAPTNPADLEARRQQLFAQMLRDPGDLDTAFEYAALSAQAGDLESAISTLERMLIFAPGLSRLQYELGVLYFRLGAYAAAETYLRAAESAADVPADAKAEVAAYLAAIDRQTQTSGVSGYVSAGARYQTNANAGPGTGLIMLNGIPFVLSPTAMGQPDANLYVGGGANGVIDMQNQGDRFLVSVTGYGTFYRTQTALDTGVVEFKAGPQFNLGRIQLENSTASLYGILGGALAGGSAYFLSAGVGASAALGLDARSQLVVKAEARGEGYFNSPARPTVALRSGPFLLTSLTYQYALTPQFDVYVTGALERRIGQTPYLRSWQAAAEVGANIAFASPLESIPAPWRLGLAAGVQRQLADGPDPIFSAVDAERITRLYLEGKLTVPLSNGFSVEAVAAYIRSISNYPLSTYDNFAASLGIGKAF